MNDKKKPGAVHDAGLQETLNDSSKNNFTPGQTTAEDYDTLGGYSSQLDALAACNDRVAALNEQLNVIALELASERLATARLRKAFTEWNYRMSGGK